MTNTAMRILGAPLGKPHVYYLGQAGFIIKTTKGTLLGIDLYLSDCVERYDGFKRLMPHLLEPYEIEFDFLIATHAHYDHFDIDAIPIMLSHKHTRMFASKQCKNEAERLHLVDGRIDYVEVGNHRKAGDISIKFVFCDHGESAPDAIGLVLDFDGLCLYVAGDTCLRLDKVAEIKENKNIDIMVAPINGEFGNLNENEAVILCEAIKPRIMIPYHFWNFAEQHGDPGVYMKLMAERLPEQKYFILRPGEELCLSEE